MAGSDGSIDSIRWIRLERLETALEHPQVDAEREHDCHREDEELPALVVRVQVETGRQAGCEEGEGHQNDVRRNELADEGVVAARHPGSLN